MKRAGQGRPDADVPDLQGLRDARLVMVTGKGGTGKSTSASAIARLLASQGRRVCLAELDSQRAALTAVFGHEPTFSPEEVLPNLWVMNITWPESLVAWLRTMIPVGRIVKAILANDTVRQFLDFVPGSREVVGLTVMQELQRRFDVVVVDMPASGHAFSTLDITRSALGLFRGGPVRARVEALRDMLRDDHTRLVVVALPEDMVVNETVETLERFRDAQLLGGRPLVLLNRALPPSLTTPERIVMDRLGALSMGEAAGDLIAAGQWDLEREAATEDAVVRLAEAARVQPVVVSPAPAGADPARTAEHIAAQLGRAMGVGREEVAWT